MPTRNKSDEAQMWLILTCSCIVQLLLVVKWVGLL